jgi:hypothetical protein
MRRIAQSKFRIAVEGVDGSKCRFPQEDGTLHTLSDSTVILNLL